MDSTRGRDQRRYSWLITQGLNAAAFERVVEVAGRHKCYDGRPHRAPPPAIDRSRGESWELEQRKSGRQFRCRRGPPPGDRWRVAGLGEQGPHHPLREFEMCPPAGNLSGFLRGCCFIADRIAVR